MEQGWFHGDTGLSTLKDLPKHIMTLELFDQFTYDFMIHMMDIFVAYSSFKLLQFIIVVVLGHLLLLTLVILLLLLKPVVMLVS